MKKRASKRQIMDLKCESSMEKLWMLLFFFQPFCTCPSFSVCWVEARTPFLWFFFLLFFKSYVRGQVLIHAGHRYSRLGLSVQLVKVIPEDVSPAHQKASSVQNSPFSHVLLWRGEKRLPDCRKRPRKEGMGSWQKPFSAFERTRGHRPAGGRYIINNHTSFTTRCTKWENRRRVYIQPIHPHLQQLWWLLTWQNDGCLDWAPSSPGPKPPAGHNLKVHDLGCFYITVNK